MQSAVVVPKLQPPGAGLPFVQRLLLKILVGPVISKITPRRICRRNYESSTAGILALASGVSAEQRMMKVLVPPQLGLEDSSRYWSLNELLEHLMIVSRSVESVILALGAGVMPSGEADIAQAKPGKKSGDHLAEFSGYAPELLKRLDEKLSQTGMNFDSSLRFRHPWFGTITLRQWYWLLMSHQRIHSRQARFIAAGLARG